MLPKLIYLDNNYALSSFINAAYFSRRRRLAFSMSVSVVVAIIFTHPHYNRHLPCSAIDFVMLQIQIVSVLRIG